MFTKALRLALVFLALVLSPAAQEPAKAPTAVPEVEAPEADPEVLRKIFIEMLDAARKGDSAQLATLTNSLVADDLGPWAKKTFGPGLGRALAGRYAAERGALIGSLQRSVEGFAREGLTVVEVGRFNTACREDLDEAQRSFLAARIESVPFFEVGFLKRGHSKGRALRFFAEIGGSFRFVGTAHISPEAVAQSRREAEATPPESLPPMQVPGKVQHARLIEQPRPIYPAKAKADGIKGTVHLEAIIGRDGRIHELRVVSGTCVLAEAAVEAVQKWRYTPTLLEGHPVEVQTTIDVVFTLSNR